MQGSLVQPIQGVELSAIIWDPDRNFFVIPYIKHPVTWYGLLFAFGFIVGYFLMRSIFAKLLADGAKSTAEIKLSAVNLTDRLAFLVVILTIVGSRLGHVFFYSWSHYKHNLFDIFKVWEGGLASHGGAVGIFLALAIFWLWHRNDYPRLTFLTILDSIVIPAAFIGGCIRIGNFMNQEIIGTPTHLPWGVIFLHPHGGRAGIPVHPVQIYESLFYFLVFLALVALWRGKGKILGKGLLTGTFFLAVFGFRFLIEFLKVPQSEFISSDSILTMGQWLSIPFILFGISVLVGYFLTFRRVC